MKDRATPLAVKMYAMFADPYNELLAHTAHRPWPLPDRPWIGAMRWNDLLFAHWRVPAEALLPHLPSSVRLDLYDGSAWLGITPFVLTQGRPRGLPPVPYLSSFPELNVRTYVTHGGKGGVWFFSLDAASVFAVLGARTLFSLRYFLARMSARNEAGEIACRSRRMHPRSAGAEFRARYAPDGAIQLAQPGTLEHWLTERYCLYTADRRGELWRCEIHHRPWPLQPARASIERNSMAEPLGLSLREPPLLHFAHRLDVLVWPICRV